MKMLFPEARLSDKILKGRWKPESQEKAGFQVEECSQEWGPEFLCALKELGVF